MRIELGYLLYLLSSRVSLVSREKQRVGSEFVHLMYVCMVQSAEKGETKGWKETTAV